MRSSSPIRSLLAVYFAGLLSSTSCAGAGADAATITLEPIVGNSDSTFGITSTLRVVNTNTGESYDDAFPIDLTSSNRIEFAVQPPPGAEEIQLSSSAPGEAIELIIRASLVDGPNVDKCQGSTADTDGASNAIDQLLMGAFFKASVVGRDANVLSQTFAWERSYVFIEKYGCVVEGRLFFQPTAEDGVISANVEKISWSGQYGVDSIGDIGNGPVAMYILEAEEDSAMIKGGDVFFEIIDGNEEDTAAETSDPSVDPTAAEEVSTSGCTQENFHLGLAASMLLVASLSRF